MDAAAHSAACFAAQWALIPRTDRRSGQGIERNWSPQGDDAVCARAERGRALYDDRHVIKRPLDSMRCYAGGNRIMLRTRTVDKAVFGMLVIEITGKRAHCPA